MLPRVTGADGQDVLEHLSQLSAGQLVLLVVVWLAGLWAYTYVLCGSLPGLTHMQALTLNLSGSAVSNLVPFGGAVGIGVTFAMTASWGFRPSRVALSTVVTGLWNVLAKLALPLVALVALLVTGDIADQRLVIASAIASVLLAVVVATMVAALSSERFAAWAAVARRVGGHAVAAPGPLGPRRALGPRGDGPAAQHHRADAHRRAEDERSAWSRTRSCRRCWPGCACRRWAAT